MEQNVSHVPKFGNWDREDEYTAYFETARREKDLNSLTMVNPNEADENPDAYNSWERNRDRNSRRRKDRNQRSRESNNGSFTTTESVSSKSNHSEQHIMLQKRESRRSAGRASNFSSSSNHRPGGSGSHSYRESQVSLSLFLINISSYKWVV